MSARPKVTVYIVSQDYGRFLEQAIESVTAQSLPDWELILIDDGSADNTGTIASHYAKLFPDRVRLFTNKSKEGLQICANRAVEAARGEYVIRLDADDFFDESALLVLADYLDRHPDVGVVYPNFVYVDEWGIPLGLENRKKIGEEVQLLDLPAHGAGTMVRKRVLKSIGGYTESYQAQDGHELWLKVIHRYKVANVSTPLFFYRQHGASVSQDHIKIQSARQQIKRGIAEKHQGAIKLRTVAVVPAKNTNATLPNIVLEEFNGKPLIDHTLEAARESKKFDHIVVTTDDPKVVEHCARFCDVLAVTRPVDLTLPHVHLSQVLHDCVRQLEEEHEVYPDVLVLLNVHCPLRRAEHISEAIDTLALYNTDNVISVYECDDVMFLHKEHGLDPINKGMLQRIRLEREVLYVDNGAINAFWRDVMTEASFIGTRIGHVLMSPQESFRVKNQFHADLIRGLLRHNGNTDRKE